MQNKSYSSFNLFIRSFIFWIYSTLSIIFYSFVCLASLPFPLRYRHYLIRTFLRAYFYVLKKVCHLDYKVEGLENIPKDKTGIIMCKHSSTWETFSLPLFFDMPAPLAKKELAWVPFFGWGLAVADPIFIDRKQKQSAMQQIIQKGKKCLAQGRWIIIFPEGTRVPYGTAGNYKLGGARLAAETGYPILPVAHNAGWYWPRKKFIKKPGTITMVMGPLIETKGRKPEDILEETKSWIETTVSKLKVQ